MKKKIWLLGILIIALLSFILVPKVYNYATHRSHETLPLQAVVIDSAMEIATFAGGCFWCMEPPFEKLEGVQEVISGYTGGHKQNPSYEEVVSGTTGHVEAVQVIYDPEIISFEELVDVFWRQIDPTDDGGQFVDRGEQYLSAIFYHDDKQKQTAEKSKQELASSGRFAKPIVTMIRQAETFYEAEDYHQDYYQKNSLQYKFYRSNSGRDQFLKESWGDDLDANDDPGVNTESAESKRKESKEDLKESLTDMQYYVTQEDGTEEALRFVPKEDLLEEGYAEFLYLFEK